MTVTITKNGNTVTLALEGSLDAQAAPELQDKVQNIDNNTKSMVIDMAKLQYIASAGIRQLVMIYKRMGGKVVIKNASVELMDIFHITGIDRMIRFE